MGPVAAAAVAGDCLALASGRRVAAGAGVGDGPCLDGVPLASFAVRVPFEARHRLVVDASVAYSGGVFVLDNQET